MTERALSERRDPWLTEREAAAELRVSTYVVRAEREAGRLGFARLRRRVFYPMSEIDAYKQSLRCPAKSNSGSIPEAGDGISPGPSVDARTALQRALQIVGRQRRSAPPSS